ncbi:hypothetical protein ACLKA7_013949 [Drosophila subpalustris]
MAQTPSPIHNQVQTKTTLIGHVYKISPRRENHPIITRLGILQCLPAVDEVVAVSACPSKPSQLTLASHRVAHHGASLASLVLRPGNRDLSVRRRDVGSAVDSAVLGDGGGSFQRFCLRAEWEEGRGLS